MEYAYKETGFMGKVVYKPSPGDSGSHVVLSKEEYDKLQHDIAMYHAWYDSEKKSHEEDVANEKRKAEKKVNEAYESAQRQLEEYKSQANARAAQLVREARDDKSRVEKELEKQINLNSNLKRIARERANQDRNITPKKEHDGYLVLESSQWTEHYKYQLTDDECNQLNKNIRKRYPDGYYEKRSALVWRSVLQTPYDASLPIAQIRGQVEDVDLWDSKILISIGCYGMNKNESNGVYGQSFDEEGNERNHLYRWDFKANYRTGFWEVIIYTTKSLRVPPERRPYLNGDKKRQKE